MARGRQSSLVSRAPSEEDVEVVGAIHVFRAGHARFAGAVSDAAMPPAAGTHRSEFQALPCAAETPWESAAFRPGRLSKGCPRTKGRRPARATDALRRICARPIRNVRAGGSSTFHGAFANAFQQVGKSDARGTCGLRQQASRGHSGQGVCLEAPGHCVVIAPKVDTAIGAEL